MRHTLQANYGDSAAGQSCRRKAVKRPHRSWGRAHELAVEHRTARCGGAAGGACRPPRGTLRVPDRAQPPCPPCLCGDKKSTCRERGRGMAAWIITTAVGTGEKGFAGDGGPASEARLNGPFDIAFDGNGNLYFSDTFNHRIRRVEAATGIVSTVAGNGEAGYGGDGGPATRPRSTSRTACSSTAPATSIPPTGSTAGCAAWTPVPASSRPWPGPARWPIPAMAAPPRAPVSPSRTGSPSTPTNGVCLSPMSPTTVSGSSISRAA